MCRARAHGRLVLNLSVVAKLAPTPDKRASIDSAPENLRKRGETVETALGSLDRARGEAISGLLTAASLGGFPVRGVRAHSQVSRVV